MCGRETIDLTIGCSFGCIYCPFAERAARRHGVTHSTNADTSFIATVSVPSSVYLSAASDAFAPQAVTQTHALLSRWLPRGTIVGIVTKGVIPDHTMDLLADYRHQVEGVSVGVSSLDDVRNRVVEPGCPPARARLASLARLSERRLPVVLRMDPIFPGLDDGIDAIAELVGAAERSGAGGVVAGYVFAWGRYLRRLRRVPLLAESCRQLTERTPMAGGMGWSVPLQRKIQLYTRVAELARQCGLYFQTCGCKDLRLREATDLFATRCMENPFFVQPLPMLG
ncbi:MAG: radical SAM protein [Candidatus Binatia bacterium]